MKQTAVEWLVEQMKLDELFNADYFIEQAKEMEKEQITESHTFGYVIGGGKQNIRYVDKEKLIEMYINL